jgi:hypothetical protein
MINSDKRNDNRKKINRGAMVLNLRLPQAVAPDFPVNSHILFPRRRLVAIQTGSHEMAHRFYLRYNRRLFFLDRSPVC